MWPRGPWHAVIDRWALMLRTIGLEHVLILFIDLHQVWVATQIVKAAGGDYTT